MRSKATNLWFSSVEKMFRENYKSLFKQTGLKVHNTNCSINANPGLDPGKFKEFFAWIEAENKAKECGALLLARAVAPACTLLCISLRCCCQRRESSTSSANRLWQNIQRWQCQLGLVPACAIPRLKIKAVWGLLHSTLLFASTIHISIARKLLRLAGN